MKKIAIKECKNDKKLTKIEKNGLKLLKSFQICVFIF